MAASRKSTVQQRAAGAQNFSINAHFFWFVGHLFTVAFTVAHSAVSIFKPFSPASSRWFRCTIYSVILSYSIVLCKAYSLNKIVKIIFTNSLVFLKNNNTLYLMLSILFLANYDIVKYIQGVLYPFAIYSFFHALHYINQNVLPPSYTRQNSRVKSFTCTFPQKYYEYSLMVAANLELTILFQLIFMNFKNLIFCFKTGLSAIIRTFTLTLIFITFVKLRYDESIHMRSVVSSYDLKINQFLYANQKVPKPIATGWFKLRNAISAYVSPIKMMDSNRH